MAVLQTANKYEALQRHSGKKALAVLYAAAANTRATTANMLIVHDAGTLHAQHAKTNTANIDATERRRRRTRRRWAVRTTCCKGLVRELDTRVTSPETSGSVLLWLI